MDEQRGDIYFLLYIPDTQKIEPWLQKRGQTIHASCPTGLSGGGTNWKTNKPAEELSF
jgi:hypothetical protein